MQQTAIRSNWLKSITKFVHDNEFPLEEGDLLSFVGKAEVSLVRIKGQTRKKIRIITAILQ